LSHGAPIFPPAGFITSIDFPGGADNLRYEAAIKRIYVACGDDEQNGAIANTRKLRASRGCHR
jgi:hypothetical protein